MISEVRVRNFKCFTALDLPLGALTLLSGLNSTGKSTVLQSLLLLRQSMLAGQLQQGRLVLNGDMLRLGTVETTLPEEAGDDVSLEFALVWNDGTQAAFRFAAVQGRGIQREFQENSGTPGNYTERPPFKHCRYVSADRMGPRTSFPTSELLVKRSRDVGSRGEYTAQYLAVYGDDPIKIEKLHFDGAGKREAAASYKLRHEVEAWLGMLSPDVQIQARLHEGLDIAGLGFTFKGGALALRTNEQRSTHVGFGLTYVLPILVAVLSSEPGDLVLIENPEAHLHPKAQREIVELFARAAAAGVQVLIETHSDHVLNGARLAVKKGTLEPGQALVHFFTHDPTTGERMRISPKIHRDGAVHDWPSGFFDEWDRALDELLAR